MSLRRLLMISTDRAIFEEGSAVRARQVEYAKEWDEVHIIIFKIRNPKSETNSKHEILNPKSETVIAQNCWAYSTQSWTKFMYPFDAIRLGEFIVQKRGITEITCQDPSLTAMAGVSLKKRFNISLEIQVHADIGSPYFTHSVINRVRKAMALSYLPKADHVHVVSNRIKEYIVGTLGIDQAKVDVRPIVVDTERVRSAPILTDADLHRKFPQFKKIVLMASRLEKEKNVQLALGAWPQVLKEIQDAGLIIVGSGSEKSKLETLAHKNGTSGSVIFEDWADQRTLFSYYKTCDLFLNTSLFEGYGMTLVEAQAAGCKIVSTNVGVVKEVGAKVVGWDEKSVADGIIERLA